ncbi:trigger factor [Lachnoclostridium phytofermentans]|uniref:FKBP-type peptidyl-prolyl cis-trans isomerase (Trigger factor)-like protein n=1 Tax=Lachnoclostridium phytofermentans (strain ATCC 700394 / DSM 18823 / ISDg) TaxID=357809 RepID=A9KK01_LACP7|nr:FKBP-type peptidyl-prolyl cis-trans isomerase [Lachnoclostridium phytofermentans]ABX42573.1 FKBP-type peptidyl-prolyl cis-trans isomerase (trigger factor)-like protein [Lachnoclostridium phytofermentans ISDg]
MKKNIFCISIILFLLVCLAGCNKNKIIYGYGSNYMLEAVNVKVDALIKLGDYDDLEYRLNPVNVTNEEINEYISNILNSYEEIHEIKDRAIIQYHDTIRLNYDIYYNNKQTYSQLGKQFMIGNYEVDKEFEEHLINQPTNQEIIFDMTVPLESEDALAGKNVTVHATVTNIMGFSVVDFTDELVKNKLGHESIEEYTAYVSELLRSNREKKDINDTKDQLLDTVISRSKFRIDEKSILKNAVGIVKTYQNMAYIYNLTLEEYIESIMKITKDEFYERCYNESEMQIKKYLACVGIANKERILISDKEVEEEIDKNDNQDSKMLAIFQIEEDKIKQILFDKAKCVE